MILPLLNMLFWTVSSAANAISLAIFKAGAVLVVLMARILRLPWAALMSVPNLAGTAIRAAAEWLIGNLVKWTLSLVTTLLKLVPKAATGLVSIASFNATALVEETRHRMEDIMEVAPEAIKGASHTMYSILEAFFHSYKHAAKYIMKNLD